MTEPSGPIPAGTNRCILCGAELEFVFKDDGPQFHDAVMFRAYGTYGSTLWDWVAPGTALVINICDGCLTDRSRLVLVETVVKPQPEVSYKVWDPEQPE
jgi:hypothetical protein